jgi:hypothetical protein
MMTEVLSGVQDRGPKKVLGRKEVSLVRTKKMGSVSGLAPVQPRGEFLESTGRRTSQILPQRRLPRDTSLEKFAHYLNSTIDLSQSPTISREDVV